MSSKALRVFRLTALPLLYTITVIGFAVSEDAANQSAPIPPIDGIVNLRQITPEIMTGSQPQGEAAFRVLAARGVKVIISVDGSTPEVEIAHKFGLRYVHVPIGYDKIGPQQRADLVEAVKTAGGPVFLHCHHGKHRGPAAAAYCGMAMGRLDSQQAQQTLKSAGTKADYTGLWDAVRQFDPPQVPAGKLVEIAEVEPVTEAMVRVEHHWTGLDEQIKSGDVQNWETFVSETLLLTEEFRELPRISSSTDADWKKAMNDAIVVSEKMLASAEKHDFAAVKAASQAVVESCGACHAAHRDR